MRQHAVIVSILLYPAPYLRYLTFNYRDTRTSILGVSYVFLRDVDDDVRCRVSGRVGVCTLCEKLRDTAHERRLSVCLLLLLLLSESNCILYAQYEEISQSDRVHCKSSIQVSIQQKVDLSGFYTALAPDTRKWL